MKIEKYQTKNGTRYKFQVYLGISPTGRQIKTHRAGFKTLADAKQAYKQLKKDYENGKVPLNKNRYGISTLNDLYKYYLERYKPAVRPQTYIQFTDRYNRLFASSLGQMQLKSISPIIAQQVVNKLAKKYKSYRNYINILNPIFDYGVMLQVCDYNPFKMVMFPKKDPRSLHEKKPLFTREELKIFLFTCNSINPFYYAFFSTLAFTGLRASECCALTWNDINFSQGTINITKTTIYNHATNQVSIENTTKTNVYRSVSIPNSLVKVLEQWRAIQHPKNDYVFAKGNKLYNSIHVNSWIKTIKKRLPQSMQNKKITSHIFRRTHSQLLLEAGVPLAYISKRLGHMQFNTTDTYYLRNSKELEKQSLKKLDTYLNQVD